MEDQPDEDPPADNGDNPDDGSSDPTPGTDPGTGSNPGGDTGSSGSGGTGNSGSGSSGTGTGGTTSQAVIRLSSHDSQLELGDRYNLEVEIEGYSVNSVTFLVDGLELQKGTSTTCNLYPTKPGTFNIKVMVNENPNLVSNTEKVEVKFPKVWDIEKDNNIKSAMNNAKNLTIDAFNNRNVMKEHGFWIILNTSIHGCHYSAGEMKYGVDAYCGDTASVDIGPMPADIVPTSPKDNGEYAVAEFHTHPPILKCESEYMKIIGPSPRDLESSNLNGIPGILFEHEGNDGSLHKYSDNNNDYETSFYGQNSCRQ